jgi:MFS family permease
MAAGAAAGGDRRAARGLLAQYLSWRWIFVAGAVLVAVGFGAVLAAVPACYGSAHDDPGSPRQ